MRKTIVPMFAALLATAGAANAQMSNPVTDAIRATEMSAARNFVGAAEEMPADKYAYHPTEAQMTFGALVLHVATSNEFLCSSISGEKPAAEAKLTATSSKDELVARVKRSFDFCQSAFSKLDDKILTDSIPFFGGRKVTKAAAILDIGADWADHYGTAAGYLRLNGMLPPTAKRKGM